MAVTAKGTPYVESSDLVANYPGASLALANHIDTIGKVLKVVRATDGTNRTTTSTVFVDTGTEIAITPSKASSSILLISSNRVECGVGNFIGTTFTDAANNILSGSGPTTSGSTASNWTSQLTTFAYVSAGSTAARTYKLRFKTSGSNVSILNAVITGQLFAIEVAA